MPRSAQTVDTLECRDITRHFSIGARDIAALNGVSLRFEPGTLTAVTGPSGCGKTTLLNVLAGLDTGYEGTVLAGGREASPGNPSFDWDSYRRDCVSVVFQDFNLIEHLTARENVEAALRLSSHVLPTDSVAEAALAALERAGVGDVADHLPAELSGGQQQRVAVARALARAPQIVLADEPTGSLDAENAVAVMELLRDAADAGCTVVVVTHDVDLARAYADTIVRLDAGRVVEQESLASGVESRAARAAEQPASAETASTQATARQGGPSVRWFVRRHMSACKAQVIRMGAACFLGFLFLGLFGNLLAGSADYLRDLEQGIITAYPLTVKASPAAAASFAAKSSALEEQAHDDEGFGVTKSAQAAVDAASRAQGGSSMSRFLSYFTVSSGVDSVSLLGMVRGYEMVPLFYGTDPNGEFISVYPSTLAMRLGLSTASDEAAGFADFDAGDLWRQLVVSDEFPNGMYDVLAGRMPDSYNEVVLVTNANGNVSDYVLYAAGLEDTAQLVGNSAATDDYRSFDSVIGTTFWAFAPSDGFAQEGDIWVDRSLDADYMAAKLDDAVQLTAVGVVKPSAESDTVYPLGGFGYLQDLQLKLISRAGDSAIAKDQNARTNVDVFTGQPLDVEVVEGSAAAMMKGVDASRLTERELAFVAALTDEQVSQLRAAYPQLFDEQGALDLTPLQWDQVAQVSDDTFERGITRAIANGAPSGYAANMQTIGAVDAANPVAVRLYPRDLQAFDNAVQIIERYNAEFCDEGDVPVSYDDTARVLIRRRLLRLGVLFVCIGIVAAAVVVTLVAASTRDAGISRMREIGVMRALGATPGFVSRLLVAESVAVGLVACVAGVAVAALLASPVNALLYEAVSIRGLMRSSLAGAALTVVCGTAITALAAATAARHVRRRSERAQDNALSTPSTPGI